MEQSTTPFEMKRKRKKNSENQMFLSKLFYIGQISTIPKFIKKKSEKSRAQLCIWKCGLVIVEIDTQLSSLERNWIQRLLTPTNAL